MRDKRQITIWIILFCISFIYGLLSSIVNGFSVYSFILFMFLISICIGLEISNLYWYNIFIKLANKTKLTIQYGEFEVIQNSYKMKVPIQSYDVNIIIKPYRTKGLYIINDDVFILTLLIKEYAIFSSLRKPIVLKINDSNIIHILKDKYNVYNSKKIEIVNNNLIIESVNYQNNIKSLVLFDFKETNFIISDTK